MKSRKNRHKRGAFDRDILLPHVPDEAVRGEEDKPLTDGERRAGEMLDSLMQDLFGTRVVNGGGTPTRAPHTAPAPTGAPSPKTPEAAPAPVEGGGGVVVAERGVATGEPIPLVPAERVTPEEKKEAPTVPAAPVATVAPAPAPAPVPTPVPEKAPTPMVDAVGDDDVIDEGQTDLFSAFAVDAPAAGDARQMGPALISTGEDALEFKRRVEASPEEFHFLLDMDYEYELGNVIGFEKILEYHEEGVNGQKPQRRRRRRAGEKREYESQGQDVSLRRFFEKQRKGHIINLAVSLVLLLLICLYERPQWVSALPGTFFDGLTYPTTYILVGIQLLLIDTVLFYKQLGEGIGRLLQFSPVDYSLCSVLLGFTYLYHAVLLFLPHQGYPALYLSPAATCLSLLAAVKLLDCLRESMTFAVVSSRKQKFALMPRVSVGGRHNSARERLMADEGMGKVWYLRPVGFVRNYFDNTSRRAPQYRHLGLQLLLIVSIGTVCGISVLASGGSAESVAQVSLMSILLCTPAISLLQTSVPLFLAAFLRLRGKGAIVGEASVAECGGAATLVIPDNELFAVANHEQFELLEGCDAHRVSVLVRALLEKVQSPLAEAVDIDPDLRMSPSELTLTEIADEGVAARVTGGEGNGEGETSLLMGSVTYLEKYGINVRAREPMDGTGENVAMALSRRLVGVAVNGQISVLFLPRHRLSAEAKTLILDLDKRGVRVVVRSKDPSVRDELFERLLPALSHPVSVMKPSVKETDIRTDRVNATVVALGSCKEAARVYAVARLLSRMRYLAKGAELLALSSGTVLAILMAVKGMALSSLSVTLVLLAWCALFALSSCFLLREPTDD